MNAPVATLLGCFWVMPLLAQLPQPYHAKSAATEAGSARADDFPFPLDQKQITVKLKLEKTRIMLGEPIHFGFVVRNSSDQPLWVLQGGDYRNALGRPESFKVIVLDAEGKKVPQPDSGLQFGGATNFAPLPAHGEKRFDLFLPHWARFERPGHYSIRVERTLVLNSRNSMKDILFSQQKKNHTIEIQTSGIAELDVIPLDQEQLGKLIDELGAQIVATPLNHHSPPVAQAIDRLSAIHDERTIPWLLKMLRKKDYEMKFFALHSLEKYDTRAAFEGLKKGFGTTEADCSSSPNIVLTSAKGLANSPYPEALPFLLTQHQHPCFNVRLTVTHALGHKVPKEKAISMLKKLAQDQNHLVSGEAKRYLQEIQRSEAPDR